MVSVLRIADENYDGKVYAVGEDIEDKDDD